MFFSKFKEFPEESKSVEFVFDNGIAINRMKMNYQFNKNSYLLYENYGNPNYIDNYEDDPLVNLIDLEKIVKQCNSDREDQISSSFILQKFVRRELIYSFMNGIFGNLINNLTGVFGFFSNSQNDILDNLANHELNSNKITLMKVSKLEKYCLFLYNNNDLLFLNLNAKTYIILSQKYLNEKERNSQKIRDFDFHPIYDNQILICKKNVLGIMYYAKNFYFKNEKFGNFNKIIRAKFFNNGENILLLHENGTQVSILKENYEIVISKKIFLSNCSDLVISPNQMFFVMFSSDKFYLFNMLNLNYEVWNDFSGNIKSVVINENGKYVIVSTDYVECPLYIIYHSSLNFFNKNNYCTNEYDIEQNYLHYEYHFFHKIFNITFSKGYTIEKLQINQEQNRMLVLYKNETDINNQAMLFNIDFNKDINNLSIEFLIPLNELNNLPISNFESCFNLQREIESFLIVWNDKKIGNFYIYPGK